MWKWMCRWANKSDIALPDKPEFAFDGNDLLRGAVDYSRDYAEDAYKWYSRERKTKRFFAKAFRILTILSTAVAGLIPILSQIGDTGNGFNLSPGWSSVALAVAGALILFDRFFGFSTGWLRFTDAMTQIRIAVIAFDMGLKEINLGCVEVPPEKGECCEVIGRCKALIEAVNHIVNEETEKWDNEFRKAIQKLDEAAKKGADVKTKKADGNGEKRCDKEASP